jgi:hypothetical protein
MPKKSKKVEEFETPEVEEVSEPEPEVKISKRTGKATRPLTELQKETLRKGREIAVAKRKELLVGVDLQKRAETIKKAKDELKQARDVKQQEKLKTQKKMYDDAVKEDDEDEEDEEDDEETVIVKPKTKPKKKKVIKYIEESSSDSEEEIIVRKKKDKSKTIMAEVSRQELRKRLDDEQSNSLARLLAPSYF